MKFILVFMLLTSFPAFAQDIFVLKYQQGTSKFEEFKLSMKAGKFELIKLTHKKTKKTHLSHAQTQRLTEMLTKISFREQAHEKCSEYLNFTLEGQPTKVCQEDNELTRDAIQFMYQLNHLF